MLTGASMMQALVTGPESGVGEVVRTTLSQAAPSTRRALSPAWVWGVVVVATPTFEGHCPEALLALYIPEANGLIVGTR